MSAGRVWLQQLYGSTYMSYLPLLLAWAQNKAIWTHMPTSRQGEALSWEKHVAWWANRPPDRYDMIIQYTEDTWTRPIGQAHISGLNTPMPEAGLYIGESSLWGKGLGKQALRLLCDHTSKPLGAHIHPDNLASTRIFEACGFRYAGPGRNGQRFYERGGHGNCESHHPAV